MRPDAPASLIRKNLFDAAAIVVIKGHDAPLADEIRRAFPYRIRASDEEMEASLRDFDASARRFFDALFPDASDCERATAWEAARELEQCVLRFVKREYGYPGLGHEAVPDPCVACPGFSDEIYAMALGDARFALR